MLSTIEIKQKCFDLGYTAYSFGKERLPCFDKKFMQLIKGKSLQNNVILLVDAWYEGWDKAMESKKLKDQWLKDTGAPL